MKTLFQSPAKLVKYALTFVGFFIALGAILTAFFGFNTSPEFGGHYELTIDCVDSEKVNDYYKEAKETLKDYGYSISDYQIEDRSYCDTLVIRYKSESEINAGLVAKDIATKLEIDQTMVQANKLSHAYNGFNGLTILFVSIGLLAAAFIIAWIIKGWNYGVGYVVSYAGTILLSLAIIGFTRIMLSPTSLIIVTVISTMSMLVFAYLAHNIYNQRDNANNNISYKDAYLSVINQKWKELVIVAAAGVLVPLVLLLSFTKVLVVYALTMLVAELVLAFISIVLVPAIFIWIEDSSISKLNKTLSRNKNKKSAKEN